MGNYTKSVTTKGFLPMIKFHLLAYKTGLFVLLHIAASVTIVMLMLMLGINPTLVLSVVAAPFWVLLMIFNLWITNKIINHIQRIKRF
jgi:hypothetical protein